ncbi:MAG: hypothetical protein GXP62_19850 [Oligoflexia bacterium]|nr:hypothetical protein [Oligoflexia bacterium]
MHLVRPRDLIVTFEPDGMVLLRSTGRGVGARAPSWAVGVLAACTKPQSRDDIIATMGPSAGKAFDGLAQAGLLVPAEEAAASPVIFANYAGIDIHRAMLNDQVRLDAYWRGLRAVIRPDDVVIDAGSGTGVLAVMAALAGARKVYAIERTDMAQVISQVASDSGVADRVSVVRGDIATVQLPEPARVMVTETFGHFALAEGMMDDVLACADRNMGADRVIVPGSLSLHLAPMPSSPSDLLGAFRLHDCGVDLRCLLGDAKGRAHDRQVRPDEVGPTIDLGRVNVPCHTDFQAEFTLAEPCQALCAWFTLHMAQGVDMPSGPHDPTTHWRQTLLPIALPAGTHQLSVTPAPEDGRTVVIAVAGQEVRCR